MPAQRPSLAGWGLQDRWFLVVAVLAAAVAVASYPFRGQLFADIAGNTEASGMGTLALFVGGQGLWVLIALMAGLAVMGIRTRASWLATLVAAVTGVAVSLGVSTAIKVLVQEVRPCATGLVHTVAVCPPAGDYSWPSNHALLAAGIAATCVLARPRSAWVAVPVAVAIAFGRVAEGVHYVHDVAAGVALALVVVTAVAWLLTPIVEARLTQYWTAPRHAHAG